MSSYLKKEISEWNTTDLCNWLIDNKYPGISELCQNNSISGYDLFFINDDILKNEFGLSSFHERKVTMKLINKLIYEHLKLTIINFNGDNVVLTLDNNINTSLGELSEYIGGMFNINPKDILYKDSSKTEVLSPSLKIINLLILYPRLYKTLNVFNMKDYHQGNENDNLESKINDNNNNLYNNSVAEAPEGDGAGSENESEFLKSNSNNNNMNRKMNFDYNLNKKINVRENENYYQEKFDNNEENRIIYHENKDIQNNNIFSNDDFDIKNKKFKNEEKNYRVNRNENPQNENSDDIDNDNEDNNWEKENIDLNYKLNTKTHNKDNNSIGQGFSSLRNRKNMNFNDMPYRGNYGKNKNMENRDGNYFNDME